VTLQVTARDAAGNATRSTRRVATDTTPPALEIVTPPKLLRDEDALTVSGAVPGEAARRLTYAAGVNGRKVTEAGGADAGLADDLGEYSYASLEETPLTLDGRRFSLDFGRLPQGRNRVVVVVRDVAGNATRKTVSVMVDTSETFGDSEMVRGAKGEDVRTLQRRLKRLHLYRGRATAIFNRKTERAVTAYQRTRKIARTGRVDAATLKRMIGRVVINLEQRKLRLIQDGRVVETYPVAVGQPAYPTPTGRYEVVDKQVDPAWFPPDSPWAAGLGTIPPGPGNPLGTRWIGTSAPAIGIHGTYARESIGTAASHGCIRMYIEDVEALYEQVGLGSGVEFR
jgi:lipoprotein-anchoring transpeptidase ErfK/SrfK